MINDKEKVEQLREYLDFMSEMVSKYGCSDSMRRSINNTHKELSEIENINTMRQEDFIKFRNGGFGFI
jgi:hypothetical protein